MDFNKRVHELLNEALAEQPTLFLVDISIDLASHIRVVLDGDVGVTLEQCMQVSRYIEPVSYTHLTLPTTPYV